MSLDFLMEDPAELTTRSDLAGPIVLSTRARIARNLEAQPFPGWANESQRRDILSSCFSSLGSIQGMSDGVAIDMANLDDLQRQILMERRLISRELLKSKPGAGVFVARDQSCSVMINEEDHLRIQAVRRGYDFGAAWKQVDALDSKLEGEVDYAFSDDLGYLTACPTNVGTGVRVSAMMHLPGLVIAEQMEKVIRAVNQLGIAVRGLFGEGSDASGSIFQISNQQTLGDSEEGIIRRVERVLNDLIEQEKHSRARLFEERGTEILDKIGRAYGILRHAYSLNSAEAMNLLSLLRLAVDHDILPEANRLTVDRALIECQPAHVQYRIKGRSDSGRRDAHRASLLREQFKDMSDLNFDNVSN